MRFYWPRVFPNVRKEVATSHNHQLFKGKAKLMSLPLKHISVEAPFQQWGLDFIGDIHLASSMQHKWILTGNDYLPNGLRLSQEDNLMILLLYNF